MRSVLILLVITLIGANGQDTEFLCDFEDASQPFCGMTLGGTDSNLLVRRGDATPSEQTGPDDPQSGDNYVHLEASGTQNTDYVELTKDNLALTSGCLRFYYHMFDGGSGDINSMRVDVYDGSAWNNVFQQQGNQGNQWNLVTVPVERVDRLRFSLYSNGQYRGDIGLDNISLRSVSCSGDQRAPPPALGPPSPAPVPRPVPPPGPRPARPRPPVQQATRVSGLDSSACPLRPTKPDQGYRREPQGLMGRLPQFLSMIFNPEIVRDPAFLSQMMGDSDRGEQEEKFTKARCAKYMSAFTVALVGGQNSSYGRVEVYRNGSWGTVCSDRFTEKEAGAVCKSVGFYGGEIMRNVPQNMRLRSDDPRLIWMDGVKCFEGTSLQECGRNEWGVTDCNHDNDVFVKCDIVPEYCQRMERKVNDTEGESNCMMYDMDDDEESRYGDRGMMGYGRGREEREKEERRRKRKCMKTSPFTVALLDGMAPSMGRVEVYLNDTWGTICNDSFGEKEAKAVCRTMGFFGGKLWRNPPQSARLSTNDPRRIWLDGLKCGEESSLKECCRNEWGVNDCNHDQDAFVVCEPMPEECKKMMERKEGKCKGKGNERGEGRERRGERRREDDMFDMEDFGRDSGMRSRRDGDEFSDGLTEILMTLMGGMRERGMRGGMRDRMREGMRDRMREGMRDRMGEGMRERSRTENMLNFDF